MQFNHVRGQATKDELCELVRKTIEETINAISNEKVVQLVGTGPHERGFTTTSGQVTLKTPKLKGMSFATTVIVHCKRLETSVEEVIIEIYLAGVSTRRIGMPFEGQRANAKCMPTGARAPLQVQHHLFLGQQVVTTSHLRQA